MEAAIDYASDDVHVQVLSFRVTQHEESLEKTLEKIQGYESRNEAVRVVRASAGTSARVTHDDQREKHVSHGVTLLDGVN